MCRFQLVYFVIPLSFSTSQIDSYQRSYAIKQVNWDTFKQKGEEKPEFLAFVAGSD